MGNTIGLISGLVVFILWMRIVGNPHVIETIMGFAIAVVVAFFVSRIFKK